MAQRVLKRVSEPGAVRGCLELACVDPPRTQAIPGIDSAGPPGGIDGHMPPVMNRFYATLRQTMPTREHSRRYAGIEGGDTNHELTGSLV